MWKGLWGDVMSLLIEECQKRFPNNTIGLEVRSFNKRAIDCYKSVDFAVKEKYTKSTFDNSIEEFYYMEFWDHYVREVGNLDKKIRP